MKDNCGFFLHKHHQRSKGHSKLAKLFGYRTVKCCTSWIKRLQTNEKMSLVAGSVLMYRMILFPALVRNKIFRDRQNCSTMFFNTKIVASGPICIYERKKCALVQYIPKSKWQAMDCTWKFYSLFGSPLYYQRGFLLLIVQLQY